MYALDVICKTISHKCDHITLIIKNVVLLNMNDTVVLLPVWKRKLIMCRVRFGVWWLAWWSVLRGLRGKVPTLQYFVVMNRKTSVHQSSKTFIICISACYCLLSSSSSLSSSAYLLNRSTTNMQVPWVPCCVCLSVSLALDHSVVVLYFRLTGCDAIIRRKYRNAGCRRYCTSEAYTCTQCLLYKGAISYRLLDCK